MRYELTNAKPEAVTVDLVQSGLDWWWADTRITAKSLKSERKERQRRAVRVPVAANGSTSVTATFETRY